LCVLVLSWTGAFGQSAVPQHSRQSAVVVRNVAVQHKAEGSSIEITSSGPLVPTVTKLNGPPRLVIDLPGAINAVRRKLGAESSDIRGVRTNQFQQNPPVTRVVVDLTEPCNYVWEMVQDKLVVHLRPLAPPEPAPAEAASAPAFTEGVDAVASTSNVAGNSMVMLAGSRIAPGSSITAGDDTAVLNLTRGGQVRVCPGTTVSVTTSQDGRDLMLGMSTGAIETHYNLAASYDSIVTPDFRIMLTGPGEFDYAFSADSKGNTCVRAMPGNSASAVVSELIGDGNYQVKPGEQVVFRGGQLDKIDREVPTDCGCPHAQAPVLRAESPAAAPSTEPPPVVSEPTTVAENETPTAIAIPVPTDAPEPQPSMPTDDSELRASARHEETAPLPPAKANEAHVIVEAPLVFRASDPSPAPTKDARNLPPVSRRSGPVAVSVLLPATPAAPLSSAPAPVPPAKPQAQSRGFFGSIKHFFAKILG
jgi:hypothetical protein